MVHFCVFGGRGGQLSGGRSIYVTLFGGSEFKRPALARTLADPGDHEGDTTTFYFFLTAFGATSIKWPTLAEEYLALVEGLRAGALTLASWDRRFARAASDSTARSASFTIFGAFETDELPTDEEELDDLSLQRHAGRLPELALEHLMLAIGHGGEQRIAAVRQAAAATLAGS